MACSVTTGKMGGEMRGYSDFAPLGDSPNWWQSDDKTDLTEALA